MLTPVDIQQKKFHMGIGYDKKDVNTFFESVAESYEELYRSNAELKEQIMSLTDGLQNYKSKEEALQKSMMLAEKDSEDTKSRANREAKNIELDAKNKAKAIIGDAEERLKQIQTEMAALESQYASYKSNFASLLKMHFGFLQENDFDVDAYIDPNALSFLTGNAPANKQAEAGGFGEFSGDPQMRDFSTLGGLGSGISTAMMGDDMKNSSSAMYGSNLSSNEGFVDPFNPDKEQPGRYNPYDGRPQKKSDSQKETQSSFKVNDGKSKAKNKTSGTKTQQAAKKQAASAQEDPKENTPKQETAKPETPKQETPKQETPKPEKKEEKNPTDSSVKSETKPESKPEKKAEPKPEAKEAKKEDIKPEAKSEPKAETKKEEDAPTDEVEVGDVEVVDKKALLGDGESDENLDDFGFEYVE